MGSPYKNVISLLMFGIIFKRIRRMRAETWLLILALISVVVGQEQVADKPDCERLNYLPMPMQLTCGTITTHIEDPCSLLYLVKTT